MHLRVCFRGMACRVSHVGAPVTHASALHTHAGGPSFTFQGLTFPKAGTYTLAFNGLVDVELSAAASLTVSGSPAMGPVPTSRRVL